MLKTISESHHFLKKSIRMFRVELFVGPHYRYKVLCIREIDNVMRITGQHVNCLYLVAAHLELNDFVGANLPLLNQSVAADYDEKLPLRVMPMLPFGDAWL